MEVETITMIELSLFITSIIGALVLLLKQLQQSKCNKVSCLCINCERDSSFNDNNEINDAESNIEPQQIVRP
jgi:basic membrane lipoprotein Med (substrate-binding protein (PBP1-ABC) superfamily)